MAVHTSVLTLPTEETIGQSPREHLYRSGGWITPALTLLMLLSVAWSLQAAHWSDGLVLVQESVLLGAVAALALSLTRWGPLFGTLYSFIISIAVISLSVIREMLPSPTVQRGVITLVDRVAGWITALVQRGPSTDNVIFVIQLCLLGWWMAHFAMWTVVRRRRVWPAVFPAAVGLLFNAYYSPRNMTPYIVVFLAAVLMLAIRVELARNESDWRVMRIRYAPDIYLDFLREGVVFAVVVIALAWFMPKATTQRGLQEVLQPFNAPWQEVQDGWNRMFGALNYPTLQQAASFGKTMTLGGPVTLSDKPLFQAQSSDSNYWRAAIFDSYTGRQWLNTDERVVPVDRNGTFPEHIFDLSTEMTVTVRTLEPRMQVLVSAPQPVRASIPANASIKFYEEEGVQRGSVSLLRSQLSLDENSVYQVVSMITRAPAELLREDSQDYPQWIMERYLQLPDSMTERSKALARQIASGAGNSYDTAAAIEQYLRTNYKYNTAIPAPPADRDAVDYFLFGIKEGYCDYYASAMVTMLRSLGIPARFVAGYAPGEYHEELNSYVVLERNAHAWVEAYFPTYGWIQFEPTASQPGLTRPTLGEAGDLEPLPSSASDPSGEMLEDDALPDRGSRGLLGQVPQRNRLQEAIDFIKDNAVAVSVTTLLLAVLAGATLFLRRRAARLLAPDAGLLVRLFAFLALWAQRLRITWPSSFTPREHARSVGLAVPEVGEPAGRLAQLFAAQQYGREPIPVKTLEGVAQEWRQVQPVLWRRWVRHVTRADRWMGRVRGAKF